MSINRKNDYAFKRIFGHEDSKDILARFLTVVLEVPIKQEELTLIHTQFSPEYLAGKDSILDIHVRRSEAHEKFSIEVQIGDEGNIERRVLFYWGKGYVEDLQEGENYDTLPRMISIVIMDFNVFKWNNVSKFHGVFRLTERDEGNIFSDVLEIHTLELRKLRRQSLKEDFGALECWGLYLNNMEGDVMEQIAEREPMIRRAMTIEDIFMQNEEERRFYEMREKGRRDYINAISTAEKRGREEGEQYGRQEGRQEGEQRGLQRGRQEGIQEGEQRGMRAAARSMLIKKTPIEFIQEVTGLSEEEIKSLH